MGEYWLLVCLLARLVRLLHARMRVRCRSDSPVDWTRGWLGTLTGGWSKGSLFKERERQRQGKIYSLFGFRPKSQRYLFDLFKDTILQISSAFFWIFTIPQQQDQKKAREQNDIDSFSGCFDIYCPWYEKIQFTSNELKPTANRSPKVNFFKFSIYAISLHFQRLLYCRAVCDLHLLFYKSTLECTRVSLNSFFFFFVQYP